MEAHEHEILDDHFPPGETPMDWLPLITALVNFTGLVVSLWLGLFLVTRSVRSQIAWMGALTVWSVGAWFLHNALQGGVTTQIWTDLLGQGMKLSIPLWFHLTCVLRFAIAPPRPIMRRLTYVFIFLSYALIVVQMLESSMLFAPGGYTPLEGPAVAFTDRWTTGSFPLFLGLLVLLPVIAIVNLAEGWSQTEHLLLRRQLGYLILATVIAYLGGVYAAVGALLQLDLPVFPADAILGLGIYVLGYAVAGYNALFEGRTVHADALYSALGMMTVVAVYSVVTLWLFGVNHMTLQGVVGVLVLAIITHALYDGGRAILDRIFYHTHSRRLRAEFRALAAEAGQAGMLASQLTHVMERLCRALGIKEAFVAVRQEDGLVVEVATVPEWRAQKWSPAEAEELGLTVDEIAAPASPELQELALLAPLPGEFGPVGVLGLGPKTSGYPFRLEDLEYVETLVPQLAMMVWDARRQSVRAQELDRLLSEFRAREHEYQRQLNELLATQQPKVPLQSEMTMADRLPDEARMVPLVEDALRHLQDYAYLGRHSLSELQLVQRLVAENGAKGTLGVTHVDRGKALHALLVQTIQGLQPGDGKLAPPGRHDIAPREWHPYLILYDCYVLGESTNEIRARLYIGEGTYNRSRRSAIKSVAHSLQELEQAQRANAAPSIASAPPQSA
jgi:hypothetical protein